MDSSKSVKTLVLQSEMSYLCEELGDPGRYFPSLRSKNLLDSKDTEKIRSKPTSYEKVEALIDIVLKREGNSSEHPLDILINELKKQRVQVHIARRLQRTLKKKIKDSEVETNGTAGGGPPGYDSQKAHTPPSHNHTHHQLHTQASHQTQSPVSESTDYTPSSYSGSSVSQGGRYKVTPPAVSSSRSRQLGPQEHGYKINPAVGPIPGAPPPVSSLHGSSHNSSTDNIDPEHGLGPGTPPPTTREMFGEDLAGPSTPPQSSHHSHMSLRAGMDGLSLKDPYMNGDRESGGQSLYSYSTADTDSSLLTMTSCQMTMEPADSENHQLRALVIDLQRQLQEEQVKVETLQSQLEQERTRNIESQQKIISQRQELVFARQELAALKQERVAPPPPPPSDFNMGRQETVVRPGTLFPAAHLEQHNRYRQLSPARNEGRNSMGSQGDNISIRSANSSTSVNSNSSFGNMPRNQAQTSSYV